MDLSPTLASFSGPGFAAFARQLHGVVGSLLVLAWAWPLLQKAFQRMFHPGTAIEWVRLWRCPNCSTFNRSATIACGHCTYHLDLGVLARWIPLWFAEGLRRGHKRFLRWYSRVGWTMYYTLTGLAAWKLQLYSLNQSAAAEFLACTAIVLLLTALVFLYRALRPRFKSPFSLIMDLVGGGAALGFFVLNVAVWAAVSTPSSAELTYVYAGQGQMRIRVPEPAVSFSVPVRDKMNFLEVNYTVFSWPVAGLRETTLLRVAGKPLASRWTLALHERFASPIQPRGKLLPRWVQFRQSFLVPANTPLALVNTNGTLTLQKTR